MRMLFAMFTLSVILAAPLGVQAAERRIPRGFREVDEAPGVHLWRKGREYVHAVSPAAGASIHVLHGAMIPSEGAGTNFARRDLREWWSEWNAERRDAYALVNAQFFNTANDAKSPLAFSTKIDGIVYAGYGDESEYAGRKLLLRIGEDAADVQPYDDDPGSLYALPEEDIIVGLKPDVSKSGNVRRGRTFVGTDDDGTMFLFVSPAATQRYAYRILVAFGANRSKIMMLDGGGSAQFIHEGTLLIPSKKGAAAPYLRPVPLAIGVTAKE